MKLNKERIELLKNSEVIIHNQNIKKDSKLLNQILSNSLDHFICLAGTSKYYGVFKTVKNTYDWSSSDNIHLLIEFLKKPKSNILIKPISWFFEEKEINNILLLI
jgi:hypothetical protein